MQGVSHLPAKMAWAAAALPDQANVQIAVTATSSPKQPIGSAVSAGSPHPHTPFPLPFSPVVVCGLASCQVTWETVLRILWNFRFQICGAEISKKEHKGDLGRSWTKRSSAGQELVFLIFVILEITKTQVLNA